MQHFYDNVKEYSTAIIDDTFHADSELNYYAKEPVLVLEELQSDGSIKEFNTTFNLGMRQYLTKMADFISLSQ